MTKSFAITEAGNGYLVTMYTGDGWVMKECKELDEVFAWIKEMWA